MTVTPKCPECGAEIPGDDVNVARDIAYCRACNLSNELSALTRDAELFEVDLEDPPDGAWYGNEERGLVIGAPHRSAGALLLSLGVAAFWNGIVSIFVLIALGSTLRLAGAEMPEWFPAPESDGEPMTSGMTIFLWIFLTPFIVIGLGMMGAFLSYLAGRTEVRISGSEGSVFAGIGPLGFCRRFDPRAVESVRIDEKQWRDSDGDHRRTVRIVIESRGGKAIRFGSMLNKPRRRFVAAAVRRALR